MKVNTISAALRSELDEWGAARVASGRWSTITALTYKNKVVTFIRWCGGSFVPERKEDFLRVWAGKGSSQNYLWGLEIAINDFANYKRQNVGALPPSQQAPVRMDARDALYAEAMALRPTALRYAVKQLRESHDKRHIALITSSRLINWAASDWDTASADAKKTFENKGEFLRVIAFLESVLQAMEV